MRSADYPFPEILPKYLGSIVQKFRKRSRSGEEAKPTKAFEIWFEKLRQAKENDLLRALKSAQMLLPDKIYEDNNASTHEFLMEIGNYDSLIATAQDLAKPVFAIDLDSETESRGIVAENYQKKIKNINLSFDSGATKIVALANSILTHG